MKARNLLVLVFVYLCLAGSAGMAAQGARAASGAAGSSLPRWTEGGMDIHFINTGRGESTFLILPDGTTLLVDAGAAPETPWWSPPAKPNASRRPGEWLARYLARMMQNLPARQIDHAVISHFHIDHMGAVDAASPDSATGAYKLGGLTDIAEQIPVRRLYDRNWPSYNWPEPLDDFKMKNYRKFIAWQTEHKNMQIAQIAVGRNDQLGLVHEKAKYPKFEIRNIAANGVVWTGSGTETRNTFPAGSGAAKGNLPVENKCSVALRITYGRFKYFTGGDLDVSEVETAGPNEQWKDIEHPVALATGPVDVMKANHHANFDANSVFFLRTLEPRVVVACTWGASQPSMNVYRRLLTTRTYPGSREVFFTNMMEATLAALHIEKGKTPTGHIVVRVEPGGDDYRVFVLDDSNEEFLIKAVFGPYHSR